MCKRGMTDVRVQAFPLGQRLFPSLPLPAWPCLPLDPSPPWQAEDMGGAHSQAFVPHNLSVTGLDFHTVSDSVAPHSHRHPRWGPHPSRWSVQLQLPSFPPLAWECLLLPSLLPAVASTCSHRGRSELCECSRHLPPPVCAWIQLS